MTVNSKAAMVGIISNPSRRLSSHNAGWTYILKSLIKSIVDVDLDILTEKDDWSKYDTFVINEGLNYRYGKYNFFGGISLATMKKLEKYKDLISENQFCFNEKVDYRDVCDTRKTLNHIKLHSNTPEILQTYGSFTNKHIVGDSHSVSVYKPGYGINRIDGKTLYGFMRDPFKYFDPELGQHIFYFGNIDVRFHLGRRNHPIYSTETLAMKYAEFCNLVDARPVCLLPIEFESRRIPKSGMYNNRPYFGTRDLRRKLVDVFNSILMTETDALEWPQGWYEEEYNFEQHMEARQSVHLAPHSYMFKDEFI